MTTMQKSFFALFCIVVLPLAGLFTHADAHSADYRFEQVFNTGAYNMGIIQDSEGFLWLTTSGGLIRYDGYQQLVFNEGPDGLTSNFVPCVFEDSTGLLWIVTLSGLDMYDKEKGVISHFQPQPSLPGSIGSNSFNWAPRLVAEDLQGRIWIGSRNGVFSYDKALGTFRKFQNDPGNPNSLADDDVWTIIKDSSGKIWIGTSAGLDVYDGQTDSFSHYSNDPRSHNSLGKGKVYAITEDRDGEIWVGTSEGGLNKLQATDGTFKSYLHDHSDKLSISHNEVFSINEDSHGNLWLGRTFSNSIGLEQFDKKTGKFSLFTHQQNEPGSLSGNIILTCFEDRSGILWVPDNTGPINKYDPYSNRFELYAPDSNTPGTKNLSGLTSVYEDSRKDIWLGGQKGLSRLERSSGKWTTIPVDPGNMSALWNSYAFSVIEDSRGDFWIASDDGYLNLFDRDKGVVTKRYLNPYIHKTARQIIEDRQNSDIFWFGVEGYGVFMFDKSTGQFTPFESDPGDPQKLGNSYICSLLQDNKNIIWIQTQGGLYRFNPETREFSCYQYNPADPHSISSNVVNDIFIDSTSTFWVSTDHGLHKFEPESGKFTAFGDANGFTTSSIRAILEDNDGNLWLGSNKGLYVFDPLSEKVIGHYTSADGLQGDSFSLYGCSAVKMSDGRLWFVGLSGANSFFANEIILNTTPPPIHLLNLSQGGEEIVSQLKIGKTKDVSLSWRHNYFEFEYAGLNFSQPQKNLYKYKLEGWENNWYSAGSKRFGRYSGLSGGDYTLKVLAANNDGVWNDRPAVLTIHVETPFWEAKLFYALLIALVLGLFSIFYFIRIRRLKLFNRELKKAYHDVQIAEKKYRSIFENAVEGIFQASIQGQILSANPSAAAIMGFNSPDEMKSAMRDVQDWMHISEAEWNAFVSVLKEQGAVLHYELQAKKKNDEIIWLSANIRAITDEQGSLQYIDGIVEDITARKNSDEQLRIYREHLEHLVDERTKKYQEITVNLQEEIRERERVEEELLRARKLDSIGVLAGGIAHDFNNLMTVVMGNIDLARLKAGLVVAKELGKAMQALQRAKELTQKFITFSSGGDPIKQVEDIVNVTCSVVDLALSGSNVQAEFNIASEIHQVSVDKNLISQAMHNVIENSKQAMQKGGILRVAIHNLLNDTISLTEMPIVPGDYVVVDFQDGGEGILPEHLSKVFDPYFTTADMGEQKGKGLGLTITYSIIKKHGGYLFVDSEVGKGTRVRLLLPAVNHDADLGEAGEPHPLGRVALKKRVLLMDDEQMLRETAELMITSMGHEIALAPDGGTAITIFKQSLEQGRRFDIVILDLTIPGGIGGKEVVKILRHLDAEVKAIVSSGYSDDPVVADYSEYGFDDALLKPYDMTELQKILENT